MSVSTTLCAASSSPNKTCRSSWTGAWVRPTSSHGKLIADRMGTLPLSCERADSSSAMHRESRGRKRGIGRARGEAPAAAPRPRGRRPGLARPVRQLRPRLASVPTPTDLCFTSATELAALYRQGHVSPLEVTQAVLARIERVNPIVNAYCTVAADEAIRAAGDAAAALRQGRRL